MYHIQATKRFRKDVKRLKKSHVDLSRLGLIIDQLAAGETLLPEYRDHALRGEMAGSRECHIAPDWLLRYVKEDERLILILIGTGSHRDVLGRE